jgi:hypothetical protein
MNEFVKNVLTGVAAMAAVAAVLFVWVGIPLLWMTDSEDDLTLLGAVWIFLPVSILVGSVLAVLGAVIRRP